MKMSWVKYLVLLFLSFIITIIVSLVDAIVRNQLVAGVAGFPFRFSETALFGGGETDYFYLSLDVILWFVLILLLINYFPKFNKIKK